MYKYVKLNTDVDPSRRGTVPMLQTCSSSSHPSWPGYNL